MGSSVPTQEPHQQETLLATHHHHHPYLDPPVQQENSLFEGDYVKLEEGARLVHIQEPIQDAAVQHTLLYGTAQFKLHNDE